MEYILLPFVAWVVAGCCKFLVNRIRFGNKATSLIGYGGFPSTHTTVLSSVVFFAGLTLGFHSPVFTLGMGALVILVIDAHGLRRKVGEQAAAINELREKVGIKKEPLREKMGHQWHEIAGGLVLGFVLAYIASMI